MKYSIEFIKGLSALAEGNYDKASSHLKNAALERSDRIEAYFAAGLVFRKNKQYDRAIYVLESIMRSGDIDASTKRALTVELGRINFEAGNFTTAHSLLEMTTDKEGITLRAKALRKLKRFEEAANTYKMLAKQERINLDKEIGFCYFRCAMDATGSRQAKFLKTAQKYIPDSRCALMMNIDNILSMSKSSKALADIEKFVTKGLPASDADMQKFQSIYFDLGQTEELMKIVIRAIQKESKNPFLYTYAVSRFLHGSNKEKAQEIVDMYLDRFGFNNTIARASLKISPNAMLEKYLETADYYKCSDCGTKTKQYTDTCPHCQGFETLKPL